MRETAGLIRSRVRGRPALVRRLRGLLLATHRFARGRARSRADLHWAAHTIDGLEGLLQPDHPLAEETNPSHHRSTPDDHDADHHHVEPIHPPPVTRAGPGTRRRTFRTGLHDLPLVPRHRALGRRI